MQNSSDVCQAAKKAKTAKPDNGEEDLASLHAAAELLDNMLKVRRLRALADAIRMPSVSCRSAAVSCVSGERGSQPQRLRCQAST